MKNPEKGVDAYEIEIQPDAGGKVKEVSIDPKTGEVLSVNDDDDDKFLGIF